MHRFFGANLIQALAKQRPPWRRSMSAEKHKTGAAGAPTVDLAALRARYRDERDLRLRSEGKAQYVEVTGGFARYLDDPWADSGFARAPISEETEVLVVGGGFGGLLCAARLREA